MRKAFTLFEIIIVIVIISIVYIFAVNSFSKINIAPKSITLQNLKSKLVNTDYENSISLKVIDESFDGLLFVDGELQEEIVTGLFEEQPTVYRYSKELETLEFLELDLGDMRSYNVVFEYSCNEHRRCSEYVVETASKTYVYNDIHMQPIVLEYISDVNEYFSKQIEEVKDAF